MFLRLFGKEVLALGGLGRGETRFPEGVLERNGMGEADGGVFWGGVRALCPSSPPGSQRQPELPLRQDHGRLHPPLQVRERRGPAGGEQLPAPGGGVSGCGGRDAAPLRQLLPSHPSPGHGKRREGAQFPEPPPGGLEVAVPKPRMFSRIKLKSLERVCVDPNAPWVKKLLQDLPKL